MKYNYFFNKTWIKIKLLITLFLFSILPRHYFLESVWIFQLSLSVASGQANTWTLEAIQFVIYAAGDFLYSNSWLFLLSFYSSMYISTEVKLKSYFGLENQNCAIKMPKSSQPFIRCTDFLGCWFLSKYLICFHNVL